MKLITEQAVQSEFLIEEIDGKKNYKIKGIFLQSDIKNRNGRVYPKEILEKASKCKNIIFKKDISDKQLVYLYNQCEVFVYPSLYEGFGFTPLEAMGCENVVIVSDIEVIKEVCEENVIYCNPLDEVDIKNKILQVIENKDIQKKYRKKAINRAREFNWEITVKHYIKVFLQ